MSAMTRNNRGMVAAVCTSRRKGTVKKAVDSALMVAGHGISGDAHAGAWHRQVSLLDQAQIDRMRAKGLDLRPGAFGENLVTRGIDLDALEVGDLLEIGDDVVVEITQRGKECHTRCAIYHRTGECIMPVHGLFARVVRGGHVRPGVWIRAIGKDNLGQRQPGRRHEERFQEDRVVA